MANAEESKVPYIERRKLISVVPHANATWVDQYNGLLDDLIKGKYRNHASLHVHGQKIKNNALIQDLMEIALNEVMRSEDKIVLQTNGLPLELINFLNTPVGQSMVQNMLLSWFQHGMGMGTTPPPSPTTLPQPITFPESNNADQAISSVRSEFTDTVAAASALEDPATSLDLTQKASVRNEEVEQAQVTFKEKESVQDKAISRAQRLKERARLNLS